MERFGVRLQSHPSYNQTVQQTSLALIALETNWGRSFSEWLITPVRTAPATSALTAQHGCLLTLQVLLFHRERARPCFILRQSKGEAKAFKDYGILVGTQPKILPDLTKFRSVPSSSARGLHGFVTPPAWMLWDRPKAAGAAGHLRYNWISSVPRVGKGPPAPPEQGRNPHVPSHPPSPALGQFAELELQKQSCPQSKSFPLSPQNYSSLTDPNTTYFQRGTAG